MAISFLGDLLQTITERGRGLIGLGRADALAGASVGDLVKLCEDLISRRGEASGVALARMILDRYAALDLDDRLAFLRRIATEFEADHAAVDAAVSAYRTAPSRAALGALHDAAEPRSQELIRRLNLARDGTLALVEGRDDDQRFLAVGPDHGGSLDTTGGRSVTVRHRCTPPTSPGRCRHPCEAAPP
ncbi:MAG: malonyl-CoA decarboxylase N-terminal domain-containing protein [Gordonia polyisoprenivorans]|nr:malonyl-CoA decarboxylase N-terminal domain-containing protein [Gordonia polyisoprenivorans]